MPLHLIKLCVGCDSVQDLKDWIKEQRAKKKKAGEPKSLAAAKVSSV